MFLFVVANFCMIKWHIEHFLKWINYIASIKLSHDGNNNMYFFIFDFFFFCIAYTSSCPIVYQLKFFLNLLYIAKLTIFVLFLFFLNLATDFRCYVGLFKVSNVWKEKVIRPSASLQQLSSSCIILILYVGRSAEYT